MSPEQEQQASRLLALAQDGDRAAYGDLLVLLTGGARAYVRARIGGAGWVDDVVQDTLLTLHQARHTYDPGRPFAPWFYAILRNRFIDAVRRQKRVATREVAGDELPEKGDAPVGDARDVIDAEAVRAALRALPARQREVITRMKFRDESVREVAERLGMTESAVKVTAHRGYKAMRRWLGGNRGEN